MKKLNLYSTSKSDNHSPFLSKTQLETKRQKRPGYPSYGFLSKNKAGNYRRLSKKAMLEERLEKLSLIKKYSKTSIDKNFTLPEEVWVAMIDLLIVEEGRFRMKALN